MELFCFMSWQLLLPLAIGMFDQQKGLGPALKDTNKMHAESGQEEAFGRGMPEAGLRAGRDGRDGRSKESLPFP